VDVIGAFIIQDVAEPEDPKVRRTRVIRVIEIISIEKTNSYIVYRN
jgi:hypothetical protein